MDIVLEMLGIFLNLEVDLGLAEISPENLLESLDGR